MVLDLSAMQENLLREIHYLKSKSMIQRALDKRVNNINTFLYLYLAGQKVLLEPAIEQTATIKGMTKQQGQGQTVSRKFPIQTLENLKDINKEINETNQEFYVSSKYS